MKPNTLGDSQFSLSGTCPHCNMPCVLGMVAQAHQESVVIDGNTVVRLWAILRCQGCSKYVLGCARKEAVPGGSYGFFYVSHYPLGKPNEDVAPEIPDHIAADFREALRCRFVDGYNATVEMCRRAVQASCIDLKAPADKKLVHQIDWLSAGGVITTPLKEMAHRIRLGGNLGAHPPEDPNDPDEIKMSAKYADAVLEFTKDFFQHVYVMPERLKLFTFR